jgi:hypothetical protein
MRLLKETLGILLAQECPTLVSPSCLGLPITIFSIRRAWYRLSRRFSTAPQHKLNDGRTGRIEFAQVPPHPWAALFKRLYRKRPEHLALPCALLKTRFR